MTIDDYLFANFKPKKERDLFCQKTLLTNLETLYTKGLDISILLHGYNGIGKRTLILHMLKCITGNPLTISSFEPMKTTTSNDYNGLFRYDNIYYLNCKYFTNTEFSNLFDKMTPILKSRSVFDNGKIVIMTNLDHISIPNQHKIANAIEKHSGNVTFIFTAASNSKLIYKIKSLVCKLNYTPLTNKEFNKKFFTVFKKFFDDDEDLLKSKTLILNKFYIIYQNNNYNIGNTLHQINYLYLSEKINKKDLAKKINLMSVLDIMTVNLINTILKSNEIKSYEVLKAKIYKLKSLTIDDMLIIKSFLNNIIAIDKMDNSMKQKIISLGTETSVSISNSSKPVILLENFVIKLWAILKNIKYD